MSPGDTPDPRTHTRAVLSRGFWVSLFALVAIGAVLRFTGIGWGLRHMPQQFERVFVWSAWEMVRNHDLDQRSYLYPGLFFYLLAPFFALIHSPGAAGPQAYLTARVLVATAGLGSIVLTALLGARLSNPRVGLLAALFVCVSPLEVAHCHAVHPDVVLECLVLLGLLAFNGLGGDRRRDLLSGLAVGSAAALKVTGAFLAPSYLLSRWFAGRPYWSRILSAGLVSIGVFFLLTPYAAIAPKRFLGGMRTQWAFHYENNPIHAPSTHLELARFYLSAIGSHLGLLGAGLALVGAAVALLKAPRVWAPIFLFPVVALTIYTTARVGEARFLIPAGGILALAAALGLVEVMERNAMFGVLLAILAASFPFAQSLRFVHDIRQPSSLDKAADWIIANVPSGGWVLTTEKHLLLDKNSYHLVWAEGAPNEPSVWNQRVARGVDVVVTTPEDSLVSSFDEVLRADPGANLTQLGRPLALFKPPQSSPLNLSRAELSASKGGRKRLLDPMVPAFRPRDPCRRSDFIEVRLPSPVGLERVELILEGTIRTPLRAFAGPKEEELVELPVSEVDFEGRGDLPPEEVLFFDPRAPTMRILRLSPQWNCSSPWRIRDIKLFTSSSRETGDPDAAGRRVGIYSDTLERVAR